MIRFRELRPEVCDACDSAREKTNEVRERKLARIDFPTLNYVRLHSNPAGRQGRETMMRFTRSLFTRYGATFALASAVLVAIMATA